MVDPVVTGALIWLVQRLLDKGFDRVLDATFDKRAPSQQTPMVTARRHDLTVDGAQGTSDVDVLVRHHLPAARIPVILTFQKFGNTADGTTFPMVLGDTAHLTLRRDHYLIAALAVDLPRIAGAKPTLRGVGWTQQWVADNHVRQVTIATQQPTEKLVAELGLTKSDGSCPFILASPPAAPPRPVIANSPFSTSPQVDPAATFRKFMQQQGAAKAQPRRIADFLNVSCRARTGLPNERCQNAVHVDRLCLVHWVQASNGHAVHDFATGERLWTG